MNYNDYTKYYYFILLCDTRPLVRTVRNPANSRVLQWNVSVSPPRTRSIIERSTIERARSIVITNWSLDIIIRTFKQLRNKIARDRSSNVRQQTFFFQRLLGLGGLKPRPVPSLIAVPNVTAYPSMASVPNSYYLMWHCNCLWTLKG